MSRFTIFAFALLCFALGANSQIEEAMQLVKYQMQKSAYIHNVFFRLMLARLDDGTMPDSIQFDNFTMDHTFFFQDGTSHTYNPTVTGLSQATLNTIGNNETYELHTRFFIPQATLTGDYDLYVVKRSLFGDDVIFRGNGSYEHIFDNVSLSVDLTLDVTKDSGRVVARDIHSSLSFDRCSLWAENFRENNVVWDKERFARESVFYKENWDEKLAHQDILISESLSSYFNMYWGIVEHTIDAAFFEMLVIFNW